MKYRIVALIDSSPHEFQALSALLMERAESFEVQRVNGGNSGPRAKGANRWPKGMTVRLGAPLPANATELRRTVYDVLKKKFGDKSFRKGEASHYLKKSAIAGSGSPVLTWLCDNGHIISAQVAP